MSQDEVVSRLIAVESATRAQWKEFGTMNRALSRVEGKVDVLLRRQGVEPSMGDESRRFERMYGVWRFVGASLAVALPAALMGAGIVISYFRLVMGG